MKCPNCNETDHEPNAKFCHVCGALLENASTNKAPGKAEARPANTWWVKTLRYVLFLAFILFGGYISIAELSIEKPWGELTIGMVNVFAFFMTLFLCIVANREDGNSSKKGFWRLYYDWLHFFFAAIVLVLGYLIVNNTHNLLTILLEMGVTGLLLIADFGTLEDLIDVL